MIEGSSAWPSVSNRLTFDLTLYKSRTFKLQGRQAKCASLCDHDSSLFHGGRPRFPIRTLQARHMRVRRASCISAFANQFYLPKRNVISIQKPNHSNWELSYESNKCNVQVPNPSHLSALAHCPIGRTILSAADLYCAASYAVAHPPPPIPPI